MAKSFVAMGLLLCAGLAGAQPPKAGPAEQPGALDEFDERQPLPPAAPGRAAIATQFQIPSKNRMIFQGLRDRKTGKRDGGIGDYTPVATEKENRDEYLAWTEVIQHAKRFSSADLEEYAARELVIDDLLGPRHESYRLDLLRFDGRLTKVRRLPATVDLGRHGTSEIYEALLVPFDEPSTDFVSIVFTQLPEAFADVKKKPELEWMELDVYGSAAGYFFKIRQYAPKDEKVPILIGKSVTVHKLDRSGDGAVSLNPANSDRWGNPIALDKHLQIFKYVRDDAFTTDVRTTWEEAVAWNRVLLHARYFTPEELETSARTDLKFADLFVEVRKDYKLQLVKFEGRLLMLRKMEPSQKMVAAGLDGAYEGWLVPRDEPRGNPICIVFTDPPEGVEPVGRVNKWVSFAGYSFKLARYESGERDKDDPKKNVIKRAPLLLGRAIVPRRDPDSPSSISWTTFTWISIGVIGALVGVGGALAWWYRRGDRLARQEINTHRSRNPFGEHGELGAQPTP